MRTKQAAGEFADEREAYLGGLSERERCNWDAKTGTVNEREIRGAELFVFG